MDKKSLYLILMIGIMLYSTNTSYGRGYGSNGDNRCDICSKGADYGLYTIDKGLFSDGDEHLIGEFCDKHKWVGEIERDQGLLGSIIALGIKLTYSTFNW